MIRLVWRRGGAAAGLGLVLSAAVPAAQAATIAAADAARFLEQASFGPTADAIASVQTLGYAGWLEQQFAQPATGYPGYSYINHNSSIGCPTGSVSTCYRDNYTPFLMEAQFFRNALTGPDQLRQRVAYALAQIFVVSGLTVGDVYGMAGYQTLLLNDAFGNYRQLLQDVTLNPAMGDYLDMAHNDKPNTTTGTQPNENYAREALQLFSIGLYQLNRDGSYQHDARGNRIASYTQDIIEGYAHVYTGWTYPPLAGATSSWSNPVNYSGTMVLFDSHHDTGAKTLLDGVVLPAGQDGATDLKAALDSIYNNANVGPFICKQLIQHLVTSNPSAAYVRRVVGVFDDNGSGVRGDLKAVIRAILLDPAARGPAQYTSSYGLLREPVQVIAQLVRGVGGSSDGVYLRNISATLLQTVFQPPSVFSFYPPDYPLPGTLLQAPAFAIYGQTAALNRANFVLRALSGAVSPDTSVTGSTGTQVDLSAWAALAGDSATLVDAIDTRFFHGAMSTALHDALTQTVDAIAATDTATRAKAALYLALSSADFQEAR